MPTTVTDLPPELIRRIVDILSGDDLEIFDRQISLISKRILQLDKRELGRCSLVCQHWAHVLRPAIFRTFAIQSLEDADALLSFITKPCNPSNSIAPLVHRFHLKPKVYDAPWVHRVLCSTRYMVNLSKIDISIEGRAGHLCRGPSPPSVLLVPEWTTCRIRNATFRHFGDLNAMLRSLQEATRHGWMQRSCNGRASPYSWDFDNIVVVDTTPAPTRPIVFRKHLTVTVNHCDNPWLFLRAVIHTGRRPSRPGLDTAWTPYALPATLALLEKMTEIAALYPPIHAGGDSADGHPNDTEDHQCGRHGSFFSTEASEERMEGSFSVQLYLKQKTCMMSGGPWDITAIITSTGTLRQVTISIGDLASIPVTLWAALDDLLTEGAPELSSFNVNQSIAYFIHGGFKPDIAPFATLLDLVSTNMPKMKRAGTLCFYDLDHRNRRHVRVYVDESVRQLTAENNANDGSPSAATSV